MNNIFYLLEKFNIKCGFKIVLAGVMGLLLWFNMGNNALARSVPKDINYLTALASYADYDDNDALQLRKVIGKEGWHISEVMADHPKADVKFLLLDKMVEGIHYYIIAVAGTSSFQDIKTDFNYHTSVFAGKSAQEFRDYALNVDDNNMPRVHSGFNDYVMAGFFDGKDITWGYKLIEQLRAEPNSELIITGHSLGGAVATLLGARLVDLGVAKERIHVITYGAPAVGNKLFVEKYQQAIDLRRITMKGDCVKNIAQIANRQLVQFENNEVWHYRFSSLGKYRHSMVIYLDVAMEKYWQEKLLSLDVKHKELVEGIKVDLPEDFITYKPYLQYMIFTILGEKSKDYAFNFKAKLIKNSKNGNYIITGEILGTKGKMFYQNAVKSTENLTVLETLVYLVYTMLDKI